MAFFLCVCRSVHRANLDNVVGKGVMGTPWTLKGIWSSVLRCGPWKPGTGLQHCAPQPPNLLEWVVGQNREWE